MDLSKLQREDIIVISGEEYDVMDTFSDVDDLQTMREYLDIQLHWTKSDAIHATHSLNFYPDTREIFFFQFTPPKRHCIDEEMIEKKEKN